jgi:hypothetical protein
MKMKLITIKTQLYLRSMRKPHLCQLLTSQRRPKPSTLNKNKLNNQEKESTDFPILSQKRSAGFKI